MRAHAWTPPDGLERSRPREVRLTAGGRALVGVSLALWFGAFGAAAFLQHLSDRQSGEHSTFVRHSLPATAEVLRLWRDRGEGRPRMVEYRLDVGGASYTRRSRVSSGLWSRLRAGGPVAVRYLPADPGSSRLAEDERGPLPSVVAYLAGGALALAALGALLPLRSQRRLLSEGRAAQARVLQHVKGTHGSSYEFEFTTLSGRRTKGQTGTSSKPPAVGSLLCVVYDPDHPGTHAVYPFSLVTPLYRRSL